MHAYMSERGIFGASPVNLAEAARMRLRYLAVDPFHEASRLSREEYLRHAIPVPIVSSPETELSALSESNGDVYGCHGSLFDSSSPKLCPELPQDSPWLEHTSIHGKFLSQIFPDTERFQPRIDQGEGIISRLQLVHWLCSDIEQIKLQVQKEDDNRNSNCLPTVDSSEICELARKAIIRDNVPNLSCSGQNTLGQHVKEQKPGSFISEFPSFEPPQLELLDCISQPGLCRMILGLGFGGAQLSDVELDELVALPKAHVPKAWFDILPLPYIPECWNNESTAVEARFKHIHELRRIDEACRSRQYTHKINGLIEKITPIEICMIQDTVDCNTRGEKEMPYPLKPTRLLQWFESHEGMMEKEAHNLPVGDFNIQMTMEESLTSKLAYRQEYKLPTMFPPGLVCEHCSAQPRSACVIDPNPSHGIQLILEMPSTFDWSLSSLSKLTPGIIVAHESKKLVPDLPRLNPSRSFESAVVIPELALDDQQFQFLPVPLVTCPREYMIDAEFIQLVSLHCKPCAVPATDWLYLDWHFFHGFKCTNAACFSLQAHLNKEVERQPRPPDTLTTEVVTSQKCSRNTVELRLLEKNYLQEDTCDTPGFTGTIPREKTEALLRCPGGGSQTRGEKSDRLPLEIETPCFDIRPNMDLIAENGFLPACNGSNLPQNHHTCGVEGGNVDPKVRTPQVNSDPGRKRRPSTSALSDGGKEGQWSPDPLRRRDPRLTSSKGGSDSMVNDFDFFLRARKGIPVTCPDLHIKEDPQDNSSKVVSQPALSITPGNNQEHTTEAPAFCEHEVEISMEIRKCLVSLSSDYFALLATEEISELKTHRDLDSLKQFGFDHDGNSYLASLVSDMAGAPVSRDRQMVLRALIALNVLRHTALNLCSYGIQVGHLYLENCFEKMEFLEGYIMNSRTELEEEYDHVDRGTVQDHPKLSYLDKLLGPVALEIHRAKYSSIRILLLADTRAFFTVVRRLVTLGLTPYQIDRKEKYLHNGLLKEDSQDKLKNEISEALTFSDCLLVSYAYANPSFPVQGFTMIIQYGDSPNIGPTINSWIGRYVVHFLKVLVHPEEFRMKYSISSSQRRTDCQETQKQCLSGSSLLVKPNIASAPLTDQSVMESSTLNQNVRLSERKQTTDSAAGGATEQITEENRSSERRCEMIIVANISHPNDHMLTGRRRSYQKILHLEKENLQVVERELRLPLDLILSPVSCIVVYTLGKLNLEPHNLKDKQETFQNEVLTHLQAISFSFRDCIMIFEGPTEFTRAALQISTQIYTLAFALDMQFQCFASRHPDVTDTILIQSIQAVRRSKHMPSYPIMTEGPTLAEAFLTGFPSINPLTAHAILSSACPLPLFMSYSPEQQHATVEPYEVSKHCLELFKAQCTFKAIVTTAVSDCEEVEVQTNQPDLGIPYQHQVDAPFVSVDIPTQASRPEVWESFPEFPPASAINQDSPSYNFRDVNPIDSFPEFPPVSEINNQAEDTEENRLSSTDFYGVAIVSTDNRNRLPAEVATWNVNPSERSCIAPCTGASGTIKSQEPCVQDYISMCSKGSGSADFRSRGFPNGLEINFQIPVNRRSSQYEIQGHPFQLGRRHRPWLTSASVNASKRLGGAPGKLYGAQEILQESTEPVRCPQLGVKRGASSFSSIPTTGYDGREEMGLSNALGSWNEHKRVRGVGRQLLTEEFDMHNIEDSFISKLQTCPNGIDESPTAPGPDWLKTSPWVDEDTNVNPGSRQSRRPQASLNISSLDRFRYQSKSTPPADCRGIRAKRGLSRSKVVSARKQG